ncbi:MAG: peptidylprolyl isomerase [Rikenellaceae bacterium]|jgi:peptidyl-prolyl cis-trans isomerase SurA|nr:peptidylprolyl isomerase [Rikenellaceae bacterium]
MIKKLAVSIVAMVWALVAGAQEQFIADKVVAVVGNSPILYSDIVEQAAQMTAQYRAQNYTSPRPAMSEALELLLEQKLLYNQSLIDSIGIERLAGHISDIVNSQIDEQVTRLGSIKALEEQERKPLYSIKEDMRKEIEEYYGASEMRNHVQDEIKITPGEVERFYRRLDKDSLPIIPEQYVYAQITRKPKSTELAEQRARERLLELRQRIIDGERFDRLAVMYSVDPGSALRGGEMDAAPKESFVEPFADAVAKLRPGQVSGVVETEFGFHLIQLIDKPAENLYHLRHILVKPTYTTDELMETINFLDSLAGEIREDKITFAAAAEKYSDDEFSRMNGGVVSNQQLLYRSTGNSDPSQTETRFVKDNLDPADFRYLGRLKEGEISVSFIGADLNQNQLGKILKLVEIVPAHKADLSQDYLRIEQLALSRKRDAHFRTWLDAHIDEMYVRIDPMFTPDDFLNKRWFK